MLGFFFQAEDGIRDLVRSRGLGDVYKRQKIKAVAKSIGVKTTGTEIQVAEFILAKISADEFEKLLS